MKTTAEKKAFIIEWLQGCGYNIADAEKELSTIVKYHTTGVDAVSYDYAIATIYSDVVES